jgi:hypothetical protein
MRSVNQGHDLSSCTSTCIKAGRLSGNAQNTNNSGRSTKSLVINQLYIIESHVSALSLNSFTASGAFMHQLINRAS